MRIPMGSPHMPGPGDEATWPGYYGHRNDPRVEMEEDEDEGGETEETE